MAFSQLDIHTGKLELSGVNINGTVVVILSYPILAGVIVIYFLNGRNIG